MEPINLFYIKKQKYKSIYLQFILVMIFSVLITLTLYVLNYFFVYRFYIGKELNYILWGTFIAFGFWQSNFQKKKLQKLQEIEDFEKRVEEHWQLYKFRLLFNFIICIITCLIFLLTGDRGFLVYALLITLFSIILYPNLIFFKKELNNNEITFY